MVDDTPEPLWQVVVGDKEPWRKGRLFLVGFAILSVASDLFVGGHLILSGLITIFFAYAALRLLFWLQFYFVWIGVHWVRWLQGGLSVLYGFCSFIWSFERQSGVMFVAGVFFMATGLFLGLAPPVYHFAVRQRENRNWRESIMVGVVFLLLLVSLSSGILGLSRYERYYRDQAHHFADTAFESIFIRHDTSFLLEHASARALAEPGARNRLVFFVADAARRTGALHDLKPAQGIMLLHYQFPLSFFGVGEMRADGSGPPGHIVLQLRLNGEPGDWRIDDIFWIYPGLEP